jgi:hypothetical protein
MAKKARRIRYVARKKRKHSGKKNPMGIPTIVWLLGGGVAAFFIIKKLKEKAAPVVAPAPKLAIKVPGAELKLAGDDLYADIGGTLSSSGLGSLG